MHKNLTALAGIFISALFPKRCFSCNSLFFIPESKTVPLVDNTFLKGDPFSIFKDVMSPFLCNTCIMDFLPVSSPVCPVCGLMFKSREGEDHVCGECQEYRGKFHAAKSAGVHDRNLMIAIHHLKYKGKIQLAKPLGILLFSVLINNYNINDIDMIIPVPLHAKRLRQRGFNQTYLLIKNWEKLACFTTDISPHFHVNRNFMIRSRHTAPQTLLNREKRKSNLKNAFTITDPSNISEKNILLVDDVFTTGSTVDECSKALLNKGAKRVDVLTLSRAL